MESNKLSRLDGCIDLPNVNVSEYLCRQETDSFIRLAIKGNGRFRCNDVGRTFQTDHDMALYLAASDDLFLTPARQAKSQTMAAILSHFLTHPVSVRMNPKIKPRKSLTYKALFLRGRRGSNPQPSDRQSDALTN